VEVYATKGPGLLSRRLIVGRETDEASAKWRCSQRNRALAALIISLVRCIAADTSSIILSTFGIDTRDIQGILLQAGDKAATSPPALTQAKEVTHGPG
jgi:hypothetical protein